MFSLRGKTALVTGASRGLGWAMAQSLAQAGAHVVLNARDAGALAQRAQSLQAQGLSAQTAPFDVCDFEAARTCIDQLQQQHGGLDILVANAGINHRHPIQDFDHADFEQVMTTNFSAIWVLCKAVSPRMIERRKGRIILIGSMSAINARPTISAYVASKGAVHALCKQLAVELAPRQITVNCIAPGYFATEMNTALIDNPEFNQWVQARTPAGRWGRLDEIGPAAVFLASDEASFVNGLIMTVDGGFTSAM
ncbi:SDR family NAD(P)-dependent oxidoreductase [Limnohabitans sp.]|jgi:gluconate 5-dehydrogenase|uniref:SDR family NAD(P)-dependent oxidoreductase n=1 Tax=Limnohabitans sp. TaxID=1907725 RepID=UPI003918FA63